MLIQQSTVPYCIYMWVKYLWVKEKGGLINPCFTNPRFSSVSTEGMDKEPHYCYK